MERGEEKAQVNYNLIATEVPDAGQISREENEHEQQLISLIQEDKLKYMGSIVLGLNDALVEILGTLAGLTFALRIPNWVALAGVLPELPGRCRCRAPSTCRTKPKVVTIWR
jgi:VIT1/CCC1 family predicted Fe2+/Mn2+ transporter